METASVHAIAAKLDNLLVTMVQIFSLTTLKAIVAFVPKVNTQMLKLHHLAKSAAQGCICKMMQLQRQSTILLQIV
jgi:hypothetical protein